MLEVSEVKHSLTCSAVFAEVSKNSMRFYLAKAWALSVDTFCSLLISALLPKHKTASTYQNKDGSGVCVALDLIDPEVLDALE
jgi:hypothetical protein